MKALGNQKQAYGDRRRRERFEKEQKEREEYLASLSPEERAEELAREKERRDKALRTFAAMKAIVSLAGEGDYSIF